MDRIKKLLLIWLISAVTLTIIGTMVIFLSLWMLFTKFAWAVPIKTKDASECAKALEEVVNDTGTFKTLYTDGEPAFESKPFIKTLSKFRIHHITSSAPSGMAERVVVNRRCIR